MVAIVPVIVEPAQVVSERARFLGQPLKLVEILSSSISIAILVVAVSFSAVIALIADLDRPQERTLTVSQQAPIDVRQSMNSLERSR